MHPLLRRLQRVYDLHTELRRRRNRTTYRGQRRNDGIEVCVKVVYEASQSAEQLAARMSREARLLQQMRARGVAELLDFGSDDGAAFVVTRWQPFPDVRAWRLGAPDRDRIARFAASLMGSLAVVHDHGVVHRDLHPGNVLVGRGDAAHIIDFGLSRHVDAMAHTALTATLQMVGSPRYMSPEQVAGSPLTGQSDVYSAGCVLWEALAGQPLWHHPDPVTAAMQRLERAIPTAPSVAPRLLASHHDILASMLTLDPGARVSAVEASRLWHEAAVHRRRRRWGWLMRFPRGGRMK